MSRHVHGPQLVRKEKMRVCSCRFPTTMLTRAQDRPWGACPLVRLQPCMRVDYPIRPPSRSHRAEAGAAAPAAATEGAADRTGATAGGVAPAAAAEAAAGRGHGGRGQRDADYGRRRQVAPAGRAAAAATRPPRAAAGAGAASGSGARRAWRLERPRAAWRPLAARRRPRQQPHQRPPPNRPALPPARGLRGLAFRRGAQDACQCVSHDTSDKSDINHDTDDQLGFISSGRPCQAARPLAAPETTRPQPPPQHHRPLPAAGCATGPPQSAPVA
jgi:hypothetical protein